MSHLQSYVRAMIAGDTDRCIRIEQFHQLYGYPPELVSVGLKAADEGGNALEAVADYICAASAEGEKS
jgi:hypothetical protein